MISSNRPAPSRADEQLVFEPAEALWLLSSFCTVYQRACDAELLAKECVPAVVGADVARLADLIGLTAGVAEIDERALRRLRAPIAVQLEASAQPEAGAAAARREWLIVLNVDGDDALVVGLGDRSPRTLPLASIASRLTGRAVGVAPKIADAAAPAAVRLPLVRPGGVSAVAGAARGKRSWVGAANNEFAGRPWERAERNANAKILTRS